MSDYRMSFIYQDSNEDWWFAVAEEGDEASDRKSWFDGLIYAGPCLTREDAENCADLFQNTGYVAEELAPRGLLAPPPGRLRLSPFASQKMRSNAQKKEALRLFSKERKADK